MQDAADMINVLRSRAALKVNQTPADYAIALAAQQITAGQVTLDFILDERAREFAGEQLAKLQAAAEVIRERVGRSGGTAPAPGNGGGPGGDPGD